MTNWLTIVLASGLSRSFNNGETAYGWCVENTDWFAKELAEERKRERRKKLHRKGKVNASSQSA